MKKFTSLLFVFLALYLPLSAQNNTFYSSYTSGQEVYWNQVKPSGTGYICVGTLKNNTIWAHADSTGNIKTLNMFSAPLSQVLFLHDNSVLVCGIRGSTTNSSPDTVSVLKINPSGSMAWAANYAMPSLTNYSTGGICELNHSHNLYISGSGIKGTLAFGFILETDSSGNLLKSISVRADTTANKTLQSMGPMAIAGDNTCYAFAGMQYFHFFENPNGWTDMIRIDSLLNIKWARSVLGYVNSMIIRGNKITTAANPYLFNSTYNSSFFYTYVSNFDTSGNNLKTLIMSEVYKGSTGVTGTNDGGELIYGQRGSGKSYSIAMKMDTGLNLQWSRDYSFNSGADRANIFSAMQTKDNGYIMACVEQNTYYEPTWGYIIKTDSMGFQGCTDSTVSNSTPLTGGYAKYWPDTLVISPFTITANTPTIATQTLTDTVITYCYNGVPLGVNNMTTTKPVIKVFPNPSNSIFTIQLPGGSHQSSVEIYNMLGEKVYSRTSSTFNSQLSINLSTQSAGIYFYRITSDKGNILSEGKLVKE